MISKKLSKVNLMAIGFVRVEFVQRSAGKNVCAKSAYIARSKVHFNGTAFAESKIYDWSHKDKPRYSEIILPKHVSRVFLNPEILWNEVESKENRSNSQIAMEAVFALPDDLEVSLEDKIELLKSFVQEKFIDKGLGAQVVVHPPEPKVEFNQETGEIENLDHNWHAHVLLTTRCFKENGLELSDKKARELMPSVRNGKVIFGPKWGDLWKDHQNRFFESKGMSLRVDANGVMAQIHLGPVRLRGKKAFSLLERNEELKLLNVEEIKNPVKLLEKIVEQKNIFTPNDIKEVIYKFIGHEGASELVDAVIAQRNVVQLLDPKTGKLPIDPFTSKPIEKYTTLEVLIEEKKCLEHANKLQRKEAFKVDLNKCFKQFSGNLTPEQNVAYLNILKRSRLNCIEGYAGTGKSHLLVALKNAYENEGYTVRAFGPDSATAQVLKEKGFSAADNIYHFLFSANRSERVKESQTKINQKQDYWKATQLKRGRPYLTGAKQKDSKSLKKGLQINKGQEIWLIDEATKLGNRSMLQILKFAEKYDAQVIFSGGISQLLPIDRGCFFDVLVKRYGSQRLENIQRQEDYHQKEIAQKMAKGDMAAAVDSLVASNSIIWVDSRQNEKSIAGSQEFIERVFVEETLERRLKDKEKAIEELIKQWTADRETFPSGSSLIIGCSNHEVRTLNEMVRIYRKERGEIANEDFRCETQFGEIFVSQGDKIEFGSNNKEIGVTNGMQGSLIKASVNQFTVQIEDKKGKRRDVKFNPNQYASFKLGYATTYFRSQGRTVDRAYILHSVQTNKEMFYVALTRHVKKAYLFVPKSNLNYLSYLKAQAAGYKKDYREYLAINDYFQNKSTQKYIENLVEQTSQSIDKVATVDFATPGQINKLEKNQYLSKLKTSPSLVNRLKGHSLEIWDQASIKIENFWQDKEQNNREADFYSPVIDTLPEKIRVQEPICEPSAQEYRHAFIRNLIEKSTLPMYKLRDWDSLPPAQQGLVRNYLEKANDAWSLYQKVENNVERDPEKRTQSIHFHEWQKRCGERNASAFQLIQTLPKDVVDQLLGEKCVKSLRLQAARHEQFFQNTITEDEKLKHFHRNHKTLLKEEKMTTSGGIKSLSIEQKKLLNSYQHISNEAASLHDLVQAGNQGNHEKSSSYHLTWQLICGKRNASAYQLVKTVSKENLSLVLGQKSLEFLYDQAQRHERLISRTESRSLDLDSKLKENLEPLLYQLFPEGPQRKERTRWRFGSKGSLVITCQGEKIGSYYNFEEGKGGGPIQLIQETLGLNSQNAKDWARNFLGDVKNTVVPSHCKIKHRALESESQWIALKPSVDSPAPSLKQMTKSKLHLYCREEARHAYRDENGALLFYMVRLIDKEGKKQVFPLSYGIEKGKDELPHWAFKAYQKTSKTLYNLQMLLQNPSEKVLIVEGEKTADAANQLLNKHGMICLTWSGGAKATTLTDWSPLLGREVIIWPDNDRAGFEASNSICTELRKTGVKSLRVVDQDILVKAFPPKWDLADPLPVGKESFINDLLMCAIEKSVNISDLSFALDQSNNSIEMLRVREILWRVEERLRPELEKTLKDRPLEIRSQLIKETVAIYRQKDQARQSIKHRLEVDEHQAERLAFQTLVYKAQYGNEPSHEKVLEMKKMLQKAMDILPKCSVTDELARGIYSVAIDKSFLSFFVDQKNVMVSNDIKLAFEAEILKTNRQIQKQLVSQQLVNQKNITKRIDLTI